MEKPQDGGPAFPGDEAHDVFSEGAGEYQTRWVWTGGMSLRDYFAAKALQGVMVTCSTHDGADQLQKLMGADYERWAGHKWMAMLAYRLADAMLKARG